MRTIGVEVADKITQMNNNDYMLMDASAVEYKLADGSTTSVQAVLENSIDKLTKEGVEGLLGLTKEEIEAMADLILDTEVRIDKTYSSSKIYSAIQDAIDSSKNFTLNEIGKMSGASYKVVTSTTEMTDEKIIYLLENGTTYDMYIVETDGTVTKIGDTTIDLSSYLKVTDAESAYLKKTEATSTYVAQTSFNNHITDTVAHLTQFEKNKLLTTDNITSTINNSSDNTQIPSAKATYDLANTKADVRHTHNTSDITDLSIPTKVGDLENDRGYLTKTDANKLNCVTIDNVSLKEYILTNFTETEKTYYLIAKTTCTDLPKASNFYITVETPGLYTYKVTAKELNDSNGIYVCTYRTISSSWTDWQRVLLNGDIIDNLTSTDTDKPLSANQGKVLKDELAELEKKRVYNSLEELNTAKGLSLSLTNGEDNTMKIVDALSPAETFADYFSNNIKDNRFGIDTNTYGYDISLLTITKFNDNITIIRAFMSNGKLLVRRYARGVLGDWECDSTDLTEINTRLTQLENTTTGKHMITIDNTGGKEVKYFKIVNTPINSSGYMVSMVGFRINTTASNEIFSLNKYINRYKYTYNRILTPIYSSSVNTVEPSESCYLVLGDDYALYVAIGSYCLAKIEFMGISGKLIKEEVDSLPTAEFTSYKQTSVT